MYHKSNLGQFASVVERYADVDGYVPDAGDDWRAMRYDGEFTDEGWAEHVAASVMATADANAGVAQWGGQ
jgi:hypothetical protein